jgi:hypothetical protein
MLRLSPENESANGGSSVSIRAYQIDGMEAIGILEWEFWTGRSSKKSDGGLSSAGR